MSAPHSPGGHAFVVAQGLVDVVEGVFEHGVPGFLGPDRRPMQYRIGSCTIVK